MVCIGNESENKNEAVFIAMDGGSWLEYKTKQNLKQICDALWKARLGAQIQFSGCRSV